MDKVQLAVEDAIRYEKTQELKYILLMLSVSMILLSIVLYTVLFYLIIEVRTSPHALLLFIYLFFINIRMALVSYCGGEDDHHWPLWPVRFLYGIVLV